ncbi:MAG: aldo/keto reductase [Armatimonadetes bacterium]|nr:aldo/keto reductase [Armatimonadota bacterium]
MIYGQISGIDKPVSRLVQGTVMINSAEKEQGFRLLDAIFEQGCTAFDTAHVYGNGDNERTVGEWIRTRNIRDQVVVLGKGAHPMHGRNRVTPEDIRSDISESLERFGFDKIDLYLLHRDDPSVPIDEIVGALDDEKRAGRIDAYGGSNWTHQRIQSAKEYAEQKGKTPFAASSPHFSLAKQVKPPWEGCVTITGDAEAQEFYRANQMPLFAWSSLAGGFFSGRFRRDNLAEFDGYLDKLCVDSYCVEENFQILDRVQEVARERGLTAAQIALAWAFAQGFNLFALVGCSAPEEFRENAKALQLADALQPFIQQLD